MVRIHVINAILLGSVYRADYKEWRICLCVLDVVVKADKGATADGYVKDVSTQREPAPMTLKTGCYLNYITSQMYCFRKDSLLQDLWWKKNYLMRNAYDVNDKNLIVIRHNHVTRVLRYRGKRLLLLVITVDLMGRTNHGWFGLFN